MVSKNVKINIKSAITFAHVSIFVYVAKKSSKIDQNGDTDIIEFGAQFHPNMITIIEFIK